MLAQHTTREGKTMLIAQMDDTHLLNTIRLKVSRMADMLELASIEQDEYTTALYGLRAIDLTTVAVHVRTAIIYLYPYLAELGFRGLEVGI